MLNDRDQEQGKKLETKAVIYQQHSNKPITREAYNQTQLIECSVK